MIPGNWGSLSINFPKYFRKECDRGLQLPMVALRNEQGERKEREKDMEMER